jgi:predicted O-methyltransferase YrrM
MDYIYVLKKENIKYKINNKKITKKCDNNKLYMEFSKLYNLVSLKKKNDMDIKKYFESTKYTSLYNYKYISIIKYLTEILNINIKSLYDIKNNDIIINNTINNTINNRINNKINNNNIDNSKKSKLYIFIKKSFKEYKNIKNDIDPLDNIYNCKYTNILYNLCLKWIKYIFTILKNGDNITFYASNHCNDNIINLYYILALIFEKVLIINGRIIICLNYNEKSEYIKYINDFDETKNMYLEIIPKPNIDELKKYLNNVFEYYIKLYNLILAKDEDKIFAEIFNFYSSFAKDTFIKEHDKDNLFHKYLQKFFIESFRRFFYIEDNKNSGTSITKQVKIHSAIKKEEGANITRIIKKYKLKKCLEIGMAFGISAFYILTAGKDISLISIDPFQKDPNQWNSMGLKLIKKMELSQQHHFIAELSYIALPKLLSIYDKNYFDFIFIDGWHTFDYTLIDFFYADKLLCKGGVILIDDALHGGVQKFVKYIETNYKNYTKIPTNNTQVAFMKNDEDSREWFFHSGF